MRNEDTRPAIIETDWDKWTSTDWDIQPGEAEFSHPQDVEQYFQPDSIDLETIKSFNLYTRKHFIIAENINGFGSMNGQPASRKETINDFISRLQSNPDDFPIL